MNENYRACYEYGEKAELKFVNIAESKGMKMEKTDKNTDIYKHIDYIMLMKK